MKIWRLVILAVGAVFAAPSLSASDALNTERIENVVGIKGKLNQKEGVFKVSLPRTDLKVLAAGVKMNPEMGLTSWAAFTKAGDHTMVMGDIVLTEDQVNPAMSAALDNGLEVTALHNHFFWETPKVMFMHIGGMGDEEKLAKGVGAVFKRSQETGGAKPPQSNIDPAKTSLDPKRIETILGAPGELKEGVYKVTIGRTTRMGDHEVGKEMGVNTWAAFVGSDENAVVDGDFAMHENEMQAVLKALRRAGINIVAIHNHMTMETPRVMFLHYWGVGSTQELARGIKSALDTQNMPGLAATPRSDGSSR